MIKFYLKHRIKLLIAVYIICGAVVIPDFIPGIKITPELQKYYDNYMNIVQQYCHNNKYNNPKKLTIEFDKLSDGEIGYCSERIFSYVIKIDKEYWDAVSEVEREQLMFHELAHCVIYKEHVNNPNNYMFPISQPLLQNEMREQAITDIKSFCN